MAWGTVFSMPNDTWEIMTSYHELQEDFDATMGFIRRNGIRRFRWSVLAAPRPQRWGTRQISCGSRGAYVADPDTNTLLSRFIGFPCSWRFNSGDMINLFTFGAFQRLVEILRSATG